MIINQGDDKTLAGLLFRANKTSNKIYRLVFDDQGDCSVLISVDTGGTNTRDLKDCPTVPSQFATGLGVTNTVAVVAKGGTITIYVDQQMVMSLNDSSLSQGQIGFEVEDGDVKSEAIFTNAKVWSLGN